MGLSKLPTWSARDGSCITTSPLSPCDVWVRECKTTRVDSTSWYHMRHDCYRAVDACLLQPQAKRILAAHTRGRNPGRRGCAAIRHDGYWRRVCWECARSSSVGGPAPI